MREISKINNIQEKAISKLVDGLLACPADLFFDFSSGKLSKFAMIGKMLSGKLKVKGMKKMKELQKIMALMG